MRQIGKFIEFGGGQMKAEVHGQYTLLMRKELKQ